MWYNQVRRRGRERNGRTPVREISITSLLTQILENFIRIEKNIFYITANDEVHKQMI